MNYSRKNRFFYFFLHFPLSLPTENRNIVILEFYLTKKYEVLYFPLSLPTQKKNLLNFEFHLTKKYEVFDSPLLPPTPYDVKELISFSTENTINPREIFIYLVMVMRSFAVL